jgi:hypothetical protein
VDNAEEGPIELGPSVLDRYSPVRVSVVLHLPESNARSFLVASALGGILDREGTRNSLKSAKDATGVLITKRRERVIGELGIDLAKPPFALRALPLRLGAHYHFAFQARMLPTQQMGLL